MLFLRIALAGWAPDDGIAQAIRCELESLGHEVTQFVFDAPVPKGVDLVFSFAPYGPLLILANHLGEIPEQNRPFWIHWDTEGIPDPRIPWAIAGQLCQVRSWIGMKATEHKPGRVGSVFEALNKTGHRFRYVGDNIHAYRCGRLKLLVNFSEIYSHYYRSAGIPALTVPWGTSKLWYEDLEMERDIDVLWMGKRRTKRRNNLLESIRSRLESYGASMYIADGIETPFIFGEARTILLNRAKITLNLGWHRHDNVFSSRFHMAAGNKSLVISEPFQPHYYQYMEDVHFVAAPRDELVSRILYYIRHSEERMLIAENAYQLVTTKMTLRNSLATIMEATQYGGAT